MTNTPKDAIPVEIEKPPWGTWEVLLDAPYCKVKRIIVNPGHRLSYQKHLSKLEQINLPNHLSKYKSAHHLFIINLKKVLLKVYTLKK